MADDSQDVAKVQVKFKTQLAQYKVTEKPFQVPVNLNRRGLSQVINHLLGSSTYYMKRSIFVGLRMIEVVKAHS
jgi:hypothetical protein